MYWFFAALDIALRIIAFHRTSRKVFGWFLAFTIPCECVCFWIGWTHIEGSSGYDYLWRVYEIAALLGLVAVTREARGKPASISSLILAVSSILALHHASRWPQFWLEPVLMLICAVNLFLGLSIITARQWTAHSAILCAWMLLTGVLYSGAALSPRSAGLAGEILNCFAFASLAIFA